mmetsp:Transcript_24752/g.28441  ORF Transcript_24752/g.28441 Transcript_24752/m.28441 type:complete len:105 (-) Transcript_24752:72-386(-)
MRKDENFADMISKCPQTIQKILKKKCDNMKFSEIEPKNLCKEWNEFVERNTTCTSSANSKDDKGFSLKSEQKRLEDIPNLVKKYKDIFNRVHRRVAVEKKFIRG